MMRQNYDIASQTHSFGILKPNSLKMKTLKLLFLLPLSILSGQMSAQIDDLLRNKDITWVAESYNDFLTEQAHEEKIGKTISRVTPLKFLNKTEESINETFVFQSILINAAKEGKIPFYKDADCKIISSLNYISKGDTISMVDPTSYEQKYIVVYHYPNNEDILYFRARQIVYYNSKKAQFGLRTLAIAPMKRISYRKEENIPCFPLFWIKVTDLKKKRQLIDKDITWAARMNLSNGMSLTGSDVKVLKSVGENIPIGHLFDVLEQNSKVPFYTVEESNPKIKYTFKERYRLINTSDTLMVINPNSDVTEIKVADNKVKMDDVKRLRLVQNWYWNDKKKRLEIWLMATAPMIDINNEMGEFMYKRPLFYRRTDD